MLDDTSSDGSNDSENTNTLLPVLIGCGVGTVVAVEWVVSLK